MKKSDQWDKNYLLPVTSTSSHFNFGNNYDHWSVVPADWRRFKELQQTQHSRWERELWKNVLHRHCQLLLNNVQNIAQTKYIIHPWNTLITTTTIDSNFTQLFTGISFFCFSRPPSYVPSNKHFNGHYWVQCQKQKSEMRIWTKLVRTKPKTLYFLNPLKV